MQSLEHIIIVIISRFSWSFHGLSTPIDDNLHHRHPHQTVRDIVEASVQTALNDTIGAMGDVGDELIASLTVMIDAVEENLQTFSPFFNTTPIVETSLSSFDEIKNARPDLTALKQMMVPEIKYCEFPDVPFPSRRLDARKLVAIDSLYDALPWELGGFNYSTVNETAIVAGPGNYRNS